MILVITDVNRYFSACKNNGRHFSTGILKYRTKKMKKSKKKVTFYNMKKG